MRVRTVLIHLAPVLLFACGDAERVNLDDRDGGTGNDRDGGGAVDTDGGGDGGGGGPCAPQKAACNNCVDDDKDGLVDGDDPHCSGPLDEDEETFATGIPGDNRDPKKQDCFFDGNSGGCQVPTCCLLPAPCDEETYGSFDPTDCELAESCIEECAPITPPGCDCFGCCTICTAGTADCYDVLINPAVSPNCSLDDLASDDCVKCVKSEECSGGECDPENCILCPGQTEDDLPDECNEMNECPGDALPCDTSADCGADDYCSGGCCLGGVD
jgi:hypothetical protein